MKKYKLAIIFTHPPFGTATSREGLDVLLAASAFCEENEILICFINDGVFNLVTHQKPLAILQKDHIATFKLIELYELSECVVCEKSLEERHLQHNDLVLSDITKVPQCTLFKMLQQAEKTLTF
ncbi:sulfurtransferase complex subunit TusC [Phocoenobacter skyensis]|uniref:Sulfurtransferase complex subunit TusC n=1 Tax=Phocoenobacter skyensis TaxID=97481 RepID=A0A1H7VEM9_9PAST|nr:sulfurtransferase complex subunit TusC [Pasteurella skyensis]MDP8079360.1 sulfurtransferase complex subunit TusC [Pasteurella skyensis]MDP8085232.1 sulfurtransferase complex subunit TusC [Pasteurella skyensis]MDP8162687.1 sulfurtransferase complex subunit TusC [Pasteurella skyensis]MDP8171423.1 sulfurtransferase complex subunit TusC [Pasteurella skyensis]MDP8173455.1 sulfurtransferase complex subunit TusC [Pasteurella skyensis]